MEIGSSDEGSVDSTELLFRFDALKQAIAEDRPAEEIFALCDMLYKDIDDMETVSKQNLLKLLEGIVPRTHRQKLMDIARARASLSLQKKTPAIEVKKTSYFSSIQEGCAKLLKQFLEWN